MTAAEPDAAGLLGEVAPFSVLDEDELGALAEVARTRSLRRGAVLWSEGDRGDEVGVIVSGELTVERDRSGEPESVAVLGPGQLFGEVALVSGDPRSATLRCTRAATVVLVDGGPVRRLLQTNVAFLAGLTALLSKRVGANHGPSTATRSIAVVARPGVPGASLVARAIGELLPRRGGTRPHLVPVRVGRVTPLADSVAAAVAGAPPGVPAVVVDVGEPVDPDGIASLAGAVDVLVIVAGEAPANPLRLVGTRVITVVNEVGRTPAGRPVNSLEPFVLPSDERLLGASPAAQEAILGAAEEGATRVVGRLARSIAGTTIGLALGGGAAFGIAHVGVLVAFERAGIPIDLVAGTSMGSLIALGHASGYPASDMSAIADRIGNVPTTLSVLDPSFSGAGILSGRRLVEIFRPFMIADTFADLVVPCRVVAMDVRSGERVDIGSGSVADAFRASASIPLVFVPHEKDGRTLVDGAMVDPVPAEVVRDMGADIVVAVNVVPRPQPEVTSSVARMYRRLTSLNPLLRFRGRSGAPDLLDVLMTSLQVVQHELGRFRSLGADVHVEVDLAEFTWIEFYRASAIVARGEVAGQAAVEEVRRVVADRTDHS